MIIFATAVTINEGKSGSYFCTKNESKKMKKRNCRKNYLVHEKQT